MGIKRNDKYFTTLILPPPVNHRKNLLAFLWGGDETLKGLETFFGGVFGLGKVFQKGISAQEDI